MATQLPDLEDVIFIIMQTDGHLKSNKEKAPELEDKDILKPSPESSKTNSRVETDPCLYLNSKSLFLYLLLIYPQYE